MIESALPAPAALTVNIFLHIPKTGGTTVSEVIRQNYDASALFDHESYMDLEVPIREFWKRLKPRIVTVLGHYDHGIHAHFSDREPIYFTMLRDPIERVLSHYSFVRNYPGYENVAHGKTLQEYLDLAWEARNGQTLQLAGTRYGPKLARAKATLDQCAVVGLTERFDESLAIMQKAFGWSDISYTKSNLTKNRVRREDLSNDDISKIEEMNALDIELYKHASARLTSEIAILEAQRGPREPADLAVDSAAGAENGARSRPTPERVVDGQ